MKKINTKYYPVYLGEDLLPSFDFGQFNASSFVVITDTNVQKIVGQLLTDNPTLKAVPTYEIFIPSGEGSKTLAKAEKIMRYMAQHNIDRQAVIIAFGGGMIGDLAGFVASVYKRGINYVQVPTTLLAQVDSSHGGKTGLNLTEGKNLIGSTHFPMAVITDIGLLKSLPNEQLSGGLAEVIKYGVTSNHKLFHYLEKHLDHLTNEVIENLIKRSIKIKTKICEKDPEELEFRKILNYGHTVGHALETSTQHSLNHGQAVALGMATEACASNLLGLLSKDDLKRQNELIARLGIGTIHFDPNELIKLMRRDKKSRHGMLYFVLPVAIGKIKKDSGQVAFEVDEAIVRQSLEYLAKITAPTS